MRTVYIQSSLRKGPFVSQAEMDALTHTERVSVCPNCSTEVPNEPSPREMNDMRHEARLRLLKAEKVRSTWPTKTQSTNH